MDDILSQNGSKGDKNKTRRAEVRGPGALGERAAGRGPRWRTAWSTAWPSGRAPPCWSCTAWRCCPPAGQLERKQKRESVSASSSASSRLGESGASAKLAPVQGVGREGRCCALQRGHLRCDLQVTRPGDPVPETPSHPRRPTSTYLCFDCCLLSRLRTSVTLSVPHHTYASPPPPPLVFR